ncbi:MAG: TrbC/VirB2 family protein [Clostridia bacterium]|nr:TrbC/VirB2 family protein [Clostridia bacterium]
MRLQDGTPAGEVTGLANNIWSTLASVLQILAVAAVVLAGIRYMFASANDKADIKKQMVILVIGAVLVFAASSILKLIYQASQTIIPTSGS